VVGAGGSSVLRMPQGLVSKVEVASGTDETSLSTGLCWEKQYSAHIRLQATPKMSRESRKGRGHGEIDPFQKRKKPPSAWKNDWRVTVRQTSRTRGSSRGQGRDNQSIDGWIDEGGQCRDGCDTRAGDWSPNN